MDTPRSITARAETVLEMLTLTARLPDADIANLARILAVPEGHDLLAELLSHVGRLAPHEQKTLVAELGALTRLVLHTG